MEVSKQKEIYKFLKLYTQNKGYPPTVREICSAVSLKSTSTVYGHLKRLEKKGFIKRNPLKSRALEIAELSEDNKEMINIPIVSKIATGVPILSKENIEHTFPLPINYIEHNNDLYMIKVLDESMNHSGVHANDYAIIEYSTSAKNNEIVVLVIDDNKYIIRRYFEEKECIRLKADNEMMNDIIEKDYKIIGKLIGIYRSYK